MILAASIICRDELNRYLPLVVEHLRGFVDQITVLDDGSTDGSLSWLDSQADDQLAVGYNSGPSFDEHEGNARQRLLELTLERKPTHVLAIDADEFIGDGQGLRAALEAEPDVGAWTLQMTEIWSVDPDAIHVRCDGAWRPYARTHVWRAPDTLAMSLNGRWRIPDRKLACPPLPTAAMQTRTNDSGHVIYHFGWADPATRQARYERYMRIDGGRFHNRRHLNSIVAPPHLIKLQAAQWPAADWANRVREKLTP